MITETFLVQVFLSFICALAAIIAVTKLSSKLGPKIGAVILSIPNVSLVSLFFICLSSGTTSVLVDVAPAAIGSLGIFVLFVAIFAIFSPKYGKGAILIGLFVWVVVALFFLSLHVSDLLFGLAFFLICYILAILLSQKISNQNLKVEDVKKPSTDLDIIRRGILGGLVAAAAVFLSKTLDPSIGGLVTMFPAVTSSTYFILLHDYPNKYVSYLASKMVSSSILFVIYVLSVYFVYPILGVYLGTLFCFGFICSCGYVLTKLKN